MKKTISICKCFIAIIVITVFIFSCSGVFAQGGPRGGGHGGGPHRPNDYRWHDGNWWVGDTMISTLALGTIIATIPLRHEVIYVGEVAYYYDGVYYYQPCPTGYAVVANPVVVVPATPVTVVSASTSTVSVSGATTIIINIPNRNGSFTPVTLIRYKEGYLGPQGEYYQGHPTVEQLKALYGN